MLLLLKQNKALRKQYQINKVQSKMSSNNKQTSQQYQLKLAVIHHPSLKTVQLIQFLQNQSNQFLHNDLPQYIKGQQKFINIMQTIPHDQSLSQYDLQEYVGILLIYSTSSDQSYEYYQKKIKQIMQMNMGDIFIITIEMDNSDKQTNLIGNMGQKYCAKNNIQFVKLTLYNSQDLINMINKNLYQLIQNYYYPNQQPQDQKQDNQQKIVLNNLNTNNPKNDNLNIKTDNMSVKSNSINQQTDRSKRSKQDKKQQYIFSYDQNNKTIKAFNESFQSKNQPISQILSHTVQLRKSRQKQISDQQEQLDESIQNIQNVLNNINHRIKQKLQSGWFSNLKNQLYMTAEKDNQSFSKIKLTQQFIDQPINKDRRNGYNSTLNPLTSSSVINSRYSQNLNSTKNYSLNFNSLRYEKISSIKLPIIKLILFHSKQKVIQLQINQTSTYDELAINALRRLNIKQSEKNILKMMNKIKRRVQTFNKELQKAIKINQQKKIQQRSYTKIKTYQL